MSYVLGAALMTAALLLVLFLGRAANRPAAPGWLRRLVFGNAAALGATVLLASGLAVLLQAAAAAGTATGLVLLGLGAGVPFALLWLVARLLPATEAAAAEDGLPGRTPPAGRPRRGRTGSRLAAEAEARGQTLSRAG